MFKLKKCIAIIWNSSGEVYGIKFLRINKTSKILSFCSSTEKSLLLSDKLKSVYNSLNCETVGRVLIGGYVPMSVVFDFGMPRMSKDDIGKVLTYDMAEYIPFSVDNTVWCYRPIPDKDKSNVRIFVFSLN